MDIAVMETNDDAAACKRHAVERGYWSDPFISLFVPKSARKAPEINRGYYARVMSIQILIEKFIKLTKGACQVVSLGAGFDTMYWKLHSQNLIPKAYIEVDFEQVTMRKCHFIKTKQALLNVLSDEDSEIMMSKTELHTGNYHLVSANLKNLAVLETKLSSCGFDRSLPTLFISECVLVYIDVPDTQKIIKWIADTFPTAFFINYEQVNMGDSFGNVMIENLKARDCMLRGVDACASLDTQLKRFLDNGWTSGDALDMATVYRCLPASDVQRSFDADLTTSVLDQLVQDMVIERIEMLDERELLDQLLSHYCLVWAYKDSSDVGLHTIDLS